MSACLKPLIACKVFSKGLSALILDFTKLEDVAAFQKFLAPFIVSVNFNVFLTASYPFFAEFIPLNKLGIFLKLLAVVAIKLVPPVGAANKAPTASSATASVIIPAV